MNCICLNIYKKIIFLIILVNNSNTEISSLHDMNRKSEKSPEKQKLYLRHALKTPAT